VTIQYLPLAVCGLTDTNVLAAKPVSAIEDLCISNNDAKPNNTSMQQLQLIRQCTAAALNFAATIAGGGSCDSVPSKNLTIKDVYAVCCESLCTSGASGPLISASQCIDLIDAFNQDSTSTLDCSTMTGLTYNIFCPSLGANGYNANSNICSASNGNGYVNPGRNLGPK